MRRGGCWYLVRSTGSVISDVKGPFGMHLVLLRKVHCGLLVSRQCLSGWDAPAEGALAECSWSPWAAKQLGGTH